ncbi:TorF family putative porin [Pararhodobacter aggregans]|uniref:TorF family putative porin n=1 Tax=Pararhodobacter aggregans TaxID=404875 RepID=UPI003A945991
MKAFKLALAACAVAATSVPAAAFELSYGVTLTSDYISRGATQTMNHAAIQPWVEASSGGFYGGLWASNVDIGLDDFELDVYGGYRWSVSNTSFDVGYVRYFYNNTGDASGELYLLGEVALGDTTTLSGGVYLGHAGGLTLNDGHVGFSTQLATNLTGSFTMGVTTGSNAYGNAGLTYDFNSNFSIDGRFHTITGGQNRVVLSVAASF